MLKLIVKLGLLAAAVALVECVLLFAPVTRNVLNHGFLDVWQRKHERLRAPGQGRVIIAGGSNVAFGIDSSRLQAELQRPAVNLGLHGGVGLAFMLQEVVDGTREGDLVVLVPEYEHFFGEMMYGELAAAELLQHNWPALKYFKTRKQLGHLAINLPTLTGQEAFALLEGVKQSLRGGQTPSPKPTVYRHDAFDALGDMVAHLGEEPKTRQVVSSAQRLHGAFNAAAVRALAESVQTIQSRGADVVVLYPPVAESYWQKNQDVIKELAGHLSRQWMMSRPDDWVYADRLFYDSAYHLNRDGRAQRTERLLELLRGHDNAVAQSPLLTKVAHGS